MRYAMWILWPSFLVGGAANALFFSVFDPIELHGVIAYVPTNRIAAYTVGFFFFWVVGASACALTCFLQRGSDEVNRRCPLEANERPVGCPRRI